MTALLQPSKGVLSLLSAADVRCALSARQLLSQADSTGNKGRRHSPVARSLYTPLCKAVPCGTCTQAALQCTQYAACTHIHQMHLCFYHHYNDGAIVMMTETSLLGASEHIHLIKSIACDLPPQTIEVAGQQRRQGLPVRRLLVAVQVGGQALRQDRRLHSGASNAGCPVGPRWVLLTASAAACWLTGAAIGAAPVSSRADQHALVHQPGQLTWQSLTSGQRGSKYKCVTATTNCRPSTASRHRASTAPSCRAATSLRQAPAGQLPGTWSANLHAMTAVHWLGPATWQPPLFLRSLGCRDHQQSHCGCCAVTAHAPDGLAVQHLHAAALRQQRHALLGAPHRVPRPDSPAHPHTVAGAATQTLPAPAILVVCQQLSIAGGTAAAVVGTVDTCRRTVPGSQAALAAAAS